MQRIDMSLSKEIEFKKIYIDNIKANINRLLNLQYRLILNSKKLINIYDLDLLIPICENTEELEKAIEGDFKTEEIAVNIKNALITEYSRLYGFNLISKDYYKSSNFYKTDLFRIISDNSKEIELVSESLQECLINLFKKEHELLSLQRRDIITTIIKKCHDVIDACNVIFSFIEENHILKSVNYFAYYDYKIYNKFYRHIKNIYGDIFIQHIIDLLYYKKIEAFRSDKK